MTLLSAGSGRTRTILLALPVVSLVVACGTWGVVPAPAPPALPLDDGSLDIRVDSARGQLVLELEPVDLPAAQHGHAHHAGSQPEPRLGRIPVNGWLQGFEVELVDESGNPVPQALLHHMNLMTPDRRELFSPMMQRIGAAGEETGPVKLPRVMGYPVTEGLRVLLTAMLHNPTDQAYEGVRVRVRITYRPGRRLPPRADVFPFYLDVMPPAGIHAYDLPPGRSEQSWEGSPAVSGRILGMGGHLHEHAVLLRLEDVTAGRVLWETRPVRDTTGAVVGMPQATFLRRLGIPIHKDRVYRLTAVYDSPVDEAVDGGAMGALGGIILPNSGEVWPPPFGDNPVYRTDLETIFGADALARAEPGGGHHH